MREAISVAIGEAIGEVIGEAMGVHGELERTCGHELAVQLGPGWCPELVRSSREEPDEGGNQ